MKIVSYHVLDDFGRVINPMLVAGQVHGGIVQGLGQAILENCVYDSETGQCLTASFTDYAMPRAEDMPDIDFAYEEIPCKTHEMQAKGCGEAGTVGAMPAVVSAVCDAIGVSACRYAADARACLARIAGKGRESRLNYCGLLPGARISLSCTVSSLPGSVQVCAIRSISCTTQ